MLLPYVMLDEEKERMIRQWSSKYNWSTRVQMKIRRLARTISDLNGEDEVSSKAIWEAVSLRRDYHNEIKKGMVK